MQGEYELTVSLHFNVPIHLALPVSVHLRKADMVTVVNDSVINIQR